jgi:hypothetical protein
MNENTTCIRCTRPVAGTAYACTACVGQTGDNLKFIEETADDLETTLTRQDRVSAGTGGRASAETPLPINLNASDVGARLRNTLTTWVRLVAEELGTSIEEAFAEPGRAEGPICGGDGSWCTHASCRSMLPMARRIADREMAAWLRKRLKTIAHREWGPQAFDELSRCAVDLARAVDSPPPMISLGRCDECGTELRAHQEATFVRCTECRESYDVARRKDELVARAGHLNMTPVDLARVISAATIMECKAKDVYNWVQRGYLKRRGADARTGKATYSLGVAWELHQKAIRRAADRARRRLESQAA